MGSPGAQWKPVSDTVLSLGAGNRENARISACVNPRRFGAFRRNGQTALLGFGTRHEGMGLSGFAHFQDLELFKRGTEGGHAGTLDEPLFGRARIDPARFVPSQPVRECVSNSNGFAVKLREID